jgi:hypothetical protein
MASIIGAAIRLAAAVLSLGEPAIAQTAPDSGTGFVSGDDLWRLCGHTKVGTPPENCTAYVLGVVDGDSAVEDAAARPYCLRGATPIQITDVVRRYLSRYPDERHYSAASTVLAALYVELNCQRHR